MYSSRPESVGLDQAMACLCHLGGSPWLQKTQGNMHASDQNRHSSNKHHRLSVYGTMHASGRAWSFDPRTPPFARGRRAGRAIAIANIEAFLTHAPHAILARTSQRGAKGRDEVQSRATSFQRGEWLGLLATARRLGNSSQRDDSIHADTMAERLLVRRCAVERCLALAKF